MIADLKPYPAMKDSGVEWLGEMPEHWVFRRTKTLLAERSEKGFPDEPLLAATQTRGVVRKEKYENRTVLALKDLHLLKVVRVGDFVISLRSFQGGIEYARERGIISPAYTILCPFEREHHAYLAHLFKSRPYIENLSLFVTGIRQGQNIDYERLARSCLPLPPLPEQTVIVRYLDHVDRRIRRYIRAKQKLIARLEEQKQAIIQQAVTGQIDVRTGQPYPAYKDSGVEWLGDVPEHWDVRRLGYLATKFGSGITPRGGASVYQENGVPFLRSQNIHFNRLRLQDVARIALRLHRELRGSHVKPGDVLLNITGASIGRVCSVPNDLVEGNVNQHVCIIRPNQSRLLPNLLAAYLSTPIMQREIQFEQSGASREGLTLQSIRNFKIVVPPIPEQSAIVEYLDKATTDTDSAIDRTRHEIDLLHEYRTRLIADIVTGKLDVQDAAAELPEVDPLAEEDSDDTIHAVVDSNLEEPDALKEVTL